MLNISSSSTCWNQSHHEQEITSLKFSRDDKCLGIGSFNGKVFIRRCDTGRLMYIVEGLRQESPITSIKWHPNINNCIGISYANGFVSCCHVETNQNLWSFQEGNNDINSIDFSPKGEHIASGGGDKIVRIYDIHSRKVSQELRSIPYIQDRVSGHSNRIYCVHFRDEFSLISSGWDNTSILWDLRSGQSERVFIGTHLNGEGLCFIKDSLVTGSCRHEDQIQFWDIGSCQLKSSVSLGSKLSPLLVYGICPTPDEKYIAACGSGTNRVSFIRTDNYEVAMSSESFEKPINAIHFNTTSFAIGLADSRVFLDKYQLT